MDNSKKTVVIGLSGGVDSSVAALILKNKGYNVIGAFMKNFSDTKNPITGECNWVEELKMARKIAAILEIKFVVFDFEKQYREEVIEPMYKDYERGLTPNPDILCNKIIKFPLFWKEARKLNADYIAMGHYAIIKKTTSGYHLIQGKDESKDQSYFLSELSQEDLSHTLFPIGRLNKEEVRKIAKENNFPNWNKKGTRGICFVGKVNIRDFLKKRIKERIGKVIDPNNNVIGTHQGIYYYTIGQRIGEHIGINITKPKGKEQEKWYVAEKRKGNIIIAAPEGSSNLKKKSVSIKKLQFINRKIHLPLKLKARVRHLGELNTGKLEKKNKKYLFIFDKPLEQLAEGQFIVLYSKKEVIASGQIALN